MLAREVGQIGHRLVGRVVRPGHEREVGRDAIPFAMRPGERRALRQGIERPADLVVGMHGASVGVDAAGAAEERRAVRGVVPHIASSVSRPDS